MVVGVAVQEWGLDGLLLDILLDGGVPDTDDLGTDVRRVGNEGEMVEEGAPDIPRPRLTVPLKHLVAGADRHADRATENAIIGQLQCLIAQ